MVALVSLQQASDHIRRNTDADDTDLLLKINAASSAVLNYLKDGADLFLDTAGEIILDTSGDPVGIPYEVQQATLILIDCFYNNRGDSASFQMGYLPNAVMALLYPLRDPALA